MATRPLTPAERYARRSRHYLTKAHRELAQGDLLQAAEKGWGAASQILKAMAERRRWPHSQHASLYRVVDRIVQETGDDLIIYQFAVANELHVNFYEERMSASMVTDRLKRITAFVERVEALLAQR